MCAEMSCSQCVNLPVIDTIRCSASKNLFRDNPISNKQCRTNICVALLDYKPIRFVDRFRSCFRPCFRPFTIGVLSFTRIVVSREKNPLFSNTCRGLPRGRCKVLEGCLGWLSLYGGGWGGAPSILTCPPSIFACPPSASGRCPPSVFGGPPSKNFLRQIFYKNLAKIFEKLANF